MNLYLFLNTKNNPSFLLKLLPIFLWLLILVFGYSSRLQSISGKFCAGDFYVRDDVSDVAPLYGTGKYLFYLVYGVVGIFMIISYRTRTYQTTKAQRAHFNNHEE